MQFRQKLPLKLWRMSSKNRVTKKLKIGWGKVKIGQNSIKNSSQFSKELYIEELLKNHDDLFSWIFEFEKLKFFSKYSKTLSSNIFCLICDYQLSSGSISSSYDICFPHFIIKQLNKRIVSLSAIIRCERAFVFGDTAGCKQVAVVRSVMM